VIDLSILWLTLALEIGLAAGYGLRGLESWLESGRGMYLHFCGCLRRPQ
jgi:hypothetical protein